MHDFPDFRLPHNEVASHFKIANRDMLLARPLSERLC